MTTATSLRGGEPASWRVRDGLTTRPPRAHTTAIASATASTTTGEDALSRSVATQRRVQETARAGDGASTNDVERAHALTSDAAASHAAESECALMANRSSRAGGARDVNKL